ncbi:MAG TPA: MFS transporter [Anaerolineaceae bacterium]|nr:MFS transporter [Anaerolineaceae bacterium]
MQKKITTRMKLGYGAGEFSSSIFFTITSFWLMNFLTDEVRLSATLAGTALLVGKIWDAVIDPLIGHLSDRTRSRLGRRRPYLLFFAIPFGIAFVLMFRNPGIEVQTGKFIWAMLTYTFFCTVYSFTNIPYNSLLPEMTSDYNERTNIAGFKQAFAVIGTLLGAGAAMPIMALFAGRTAGFIGMSAIFGFLAALSLLVTFFSVREPERTAAEKSGSVFTALKDAFTNRPFLILLTTWFLNSTAVAIMQSMLIYYYKYVFMDESKVTLAMIFLLAFTILTLPLWVFLSKKLGKKLAYIIGMSLTLLSVMAFAFFADKMGPNPALILMGLAGIGFASHYVAPWAMAPDTIEYGYARSGVRREGIYYSIWTFVIALGGALAGFLVGRGLDMFGYVPDAAQNARSILGIRLLIGILPAIIILAGNLVLAFYPLTRQRYDEVLEKIKKHQEAEENS